MKKALLSLAALLLLATPAFAERIVCASTTSTQNSGLFDYILPIFSDKAGIDVHVIAVGTGAALEMGKRGDADVVFVHAKELELQGVEEGYFVNRRDVMYNDFVVVGPKGSGGEFGGVGKAEEAFSKIAEEGYTFVSRGDNSGTHRKELSLWSDAGAAPRGKDWYLEVGQGMSKALRVANEKEAYTLTDRGTWLAMKDRDLLDLEIVFEGDPALFNQYGVMAVNPEMHGHVKFDGAMSFVNWLVSEEGQEAIGSYRDEMGNRLFVPNAD
jgi:tungstate transport system substrate-binding protein